MIEPADDLQSAAAAAAPLDIGSVRTLTSAELEIVHPLSLLPLGAWFLLAGPEHQARKRAQVQYARKLRERLARGDVVDVELVTDEEAETEMMVAATLGWHGPEGGPVLFGGVPLPFSPEAARKLYSDPDRRWLRDQVLNALERRRLFIQGSPAT